MSEEGNSLRVPQFEADHRREAANLRGYQYLSPTVTLIHAGPPQPPAQDQATVPNARGSRHGLSPEGYGRSMIGDY